MNPLSQKSLWDSSAALVGAWATLSLRVEPPREDPVLWSGERPRSWGHAEAARIAASL